jgi:hypothetical protein
MSEPESLCEQCPLSLIPAIPATVTSEAEG